LDFFSAIQYFFFLSFSISGGKEFKQSNIVLDKETAEKGLEIKDPFVFH
jgi:hypothetical protein